MDFSREYSAGGDAARCAQEAAAAKEAAAEVAKAKAVKKAEADARRSAEVRTTLRKSSATAVEPNAVCRPMAHECSFSFLRTRIMQVTRRRKEAAVRRGAEKAKGAEAKAEAAAKAAELNEERAKKRADAQVATACFRSADTCFRSNPVHSISAVPSRKHATQFLLETEWHAFVLSGILSFLLTPALTLAWRRANMGRGRQSIAGAPASDDVRGLKEMMQPCLIYHAVISLAQAKQEARREAEKVRMEKQRKRREAAARVRSPPPPPPLHSIHPSIPPSLPTPGAGSLLFAFFDPLLPSRRRGSKRSRSRRRPSPSLGWPTRGRAARPGSRARRRPGCTRCVFR